MCLSAISPYVLGKATSALPDVELSIFVYTRAC